MNNIFLSGGDFNDQGSVGRCVLPDTVPQGKQLVLETVTGFYYGDGALVGAAYLTVGGYRFAFPWVQCSAPGPTFADRRWYGFNHNVRIYINGPATLEFDADGGQGGGTPGYTSISGSYAVSGHLVDI
jgi:hypothetical protein